MGWRNGNWEYEENCLCCNVVYCYNGAQRYQQFLEVCRLYQALILFGVVLYHPSASVSSIFVVNFFGYIFFFTF